MWWTEDPRAGTTPSDLDRFEELSPFRDIIGYGAAFYRGQLVPLLLAPAHRDPRPRLFAPDATPLHWLLRLYVSRRDLPIAPEFGSGDTDAAADVRRRTWSTLERLQLLGESRRRATYSRGDIVERGIAIPVSSSDEITRRLARQAELPSSTLISYWPVPRFCGQALRGRNSKPVASVGLEFISRWGDSLIGTAGHFGLVPGDELFITNTRRPYRRRFVGAISWVMDPCRPPSDTPLGRSASGVLDLALAAVNDEWERTPVVPAADELSVDEGDLCEWNGAASGYARGDVVGALRTIEVEGVRLRNCWYLAGDSQKGDSGAAVLNLAHGHALGQVVGSRGLTRRDGKRPGTIVQNADSLLEAVADLTGQPVGTLEIGIAKASR